ncbi:MAG: pilus assembly protein [Proteobacteria bacterium]|nr:pilus assembly protein [Pseudomonadota bacterium]
MTKNPQQCPSCSGPPGPNIRQDQAGQAMVEFAIAFPVLLLLVLAIIQLALLFNAKQVVTYAAFTAARSAAVYPNKRFKAVYAARLACVPISASTGQMIKSLINPGSSGNTGAEAKGFEASQVFQGLPGAGGMALQIADKYAYSYLFTKVRFLDDQGEEMELERQLKVGEQFTVEVTHWYTLIIPLVNRILATQEIEVPGSPVKITIPIGAFNLLGAQAGHYFFPVRSHTTMQVEDDI